MNIMESINYETEIRRKTQNQSQNLQESRAQCISEPKLNEAETPPQRRKLSQRRSTHHHAHRKSNAFLDVPSVNMHHLQVSDPEDEDLDRLRTFSASKGGVINRGDSFRRRRSRSNSLAPTSPIYSGPVAQERQQANSGPVELYRVFMLGSPGVGKAALISQFKTSDCINAYDGPESELGEQNISIILNGLESELKFITTSKEKKDELEEADAYLVVYSVVDKASFGRAEQLLTFLQDMDLIRTRPVILVANKIDLARSRAVSAQDGKCLACTFRAKFIEVSVGINHNCDELLAGTLTQIRLKKEQNLVQGSRENSPAHWYKSRSVVRASMKARQMITWILGKEDSKFRHCENLQGSRVWIPDPKKVWEGATLLNDYKSNDEYLHLLKDSGSICDIKVQNNNNLPLLCNPAILIGQNDLTALSYLHEAAVLHNLEVRFKDRQAIYTYCGIVLVAINPYADLPIYGSEVIQAYRGHALGELEPHIFAVAEEAYAKLERENCNLSIIVSGESGAGKTVSAKYAMRYFAAVGGNESETQIERKVLASSPIMEAFGNAKTTRNDNSSRFGKFTKLLFKNNLDIMTLTGASMQTYLLEKSRVVFQSKDERNYHIFYQLCAARDDYPNLILDDKNKFKYLNGGSSDEHDNIADLDKFHETIAALKTLSFSQSEINDIMKVLAGILHLGNIRFSLKYKKNTEEVDNDGCNVSANDLHLNVMCDILQLNTDEMRKWLIMRQIESVSENVLIPNSSKMAEAARDALAKHIYSKLFHYIVKVINKTLVTGKDQDCCFIGVLDIYGFETFDVNSFEQFCINYANEKLQQQFNQHVFKLEQEEYLKEGIVWTMIDFYDNQPCIDLIESKLGILDLLDEECKMPRGSDDSWVAKLVQKCSKHQHFEKPRFGNSSFLVKHFSDTVKYDCVGFLEKNKDTVSKELVNVIKQSNLQLCRNLMECEDNDELQSLTQSSNISLGGRVIVNAARPELTDKRKSILSTRQNKQTVGSQFRESLLKLISTLHSTTPHYVRCIKPNEDKAAFKWEPSKIVQQLRACGVLETIRISAAGFPSRWAYNDFLSRYYLLCRSRDIEQHDVNTKCKIIVCKWLVDEDKYRFGKTQIFFRAGQVAYLEQLRSDIRKKNIIKVQSVARRFVNRRTYLRLQSVALGIQVYGRGLLARRKAKSIRENRAAIKIQRLVRGWLCRKRYIKIYRAISGIITYSRAHLVRQKYKVTLDNYKSTQIQRFCRGYLARQAYKKRIKSIILCQSLVRRFLAIKVFKKLKAEAKTISHMQKLYKGLEKKIFTLQQKIDELNKKNSSLELKVSKIPELRNKLEEKKNIEKEMKVIKEQIKEKQESLVNTLNQLEVERNEKMKLIQENQLSKIELKKEKELWYTKSEELKKEIKELSEKLANQDHVSSRRMQLLSEADTDEIHQAYQRVLKDKEILERNNALLEDEIRRLQSQVLIDQFPTSSNISIPTDEDFGYESARNTLETKKSVNGAILKTEDAEMHIKSESPKHSNTALILKLKKIYDEEKAKNESLSKHITRIKSKSNISIATEDSLRVSELEVEIEKLRQDYDLLRRSISRGVEHQEIEAHYMALQEELKRRREECIQLRAILAQQSQSLKSLGAVSGTKHDLDKITDGELMEAFQAQKLVNRQLESELSALTEEHNAKLEEFNKDIDRLKSEKTKLINIVHEKLDNHDENDVEILKRNINYLKLELEKAFSDYTEGQKEIAELKKINSELLKTNSLLMVKSNGTNDSNKVDHEHKNLATVKKKAQNYQGIFKYRHEDLNKILQKIITDLSPRTAVTLLPGLPAYILFMCIRYTDLLNTDQHVKALLTNAFHTVKKFYRLPNTAEYRILWLSNMIILYNLMKQYGGISEYMKLNTEIQNQQQLKNFDLSEYRQIILESVINIYKCLMEQIHTLIKPYIVPALLVHDEMSRGKAGRTMSLDSSPDIPKTEPKSLVNQLEHFYKQFKFFGIDDFYIEQIIKQLFHYICAVLMNSLMLRPDLCMWKSGMKIKYNIGFLENWARSKKMSSDVCSPLHPMIGVSELLQSRKHEEDVQSIYDLCANLTAPQVLKIIKSYKPDDGEPPVSNKLVEKLSKKLKERKNYADGEGTLLIKDDVIQPLKIVYKYSDIKLEEIELPESLGLNDCLTKI